MTEADIIAGTITNTSINASAAIAQSKLASIVTADITTNQIDETLIKDAFVGDFSDVTVTAADSFLYGDATDSGNTKKDTVQGILDLAGGGWEPLQAVIADNTSTSVAFVEPAFSATYTNYVVVFNTWKPATTNTRAYYEFYTGSAWLGAGYKWSHHGYDANVTFRQGNNTAGASAVGDFCDGWHLEGTSPHTFNGVLYCWDPLAATQKNFSMMSSRMSYAGYFINQTSVLAHSTTTAITNIRLSMSSGNIETGEFRLYGIKDS
ncbi:uncharacterized protein METZ01_LOCUS46652 [marine metagenome]|uniref:Uncharacterized protein n=1 Tax=marine metagenome TaxID=408172 RepID=A0A381RS39_9ZZZZ